MIENFIGQQLTEVFKKIKKHNKAQRLVSIVVLSIEGQQSLIS